MSNNSSLPQTYISSPTNHESFLIYKSKPLSNYKFKNNKFISPMHNSYSSRNISNHGMDMEKVDQEMQLINKEIKLKTKEYEILKKEHDKVEEENVIILNLLDNLLSECQEIDEPLEKRAKNIDNEDNKNQLLINKLKSKYNIFKKELTKKEETLKKLKENERTIRLYELDDKIKEAKKNLAQLRKDKESYMNKIKSINRETNRTNEKLKNIIYQKNNLKNEKRDYLNKIRVLSKENKELDTRKIILEEKVSSLQTNVEQLKDSIEKKNNEIFSLKNDERKYNELNSEKNKYEKELNSQMKSIISLNEQINKKNRQIKDDERMIISFKNHISMLNEKENELKNEESKIDELKNKKNERKNLLDEIKKLNEIIIKYKYRKYESSQLTNEKIVSFNLNVPISLGI